MLKQVQHDAQHNTGKGYSYLKWVQTVRLEPIFFGNLSHRSAQHRLQSLLQFIFYNLHGRRIPTYQEAGNLLLVGFLQGFLNLRIIQPQLVAVIGGNRISGMQYQ